MDRGWQKETGCHSGIKTPNNVLNAAINGSVFILTGSPSIDWDILKQEQKDKILKPFQDFSRVNRPIQAAESYYSNLSRVYDYLASSEKRFIRLGLSLLHPQPGERILEIGFGTGYAQQYIAQNITNGLSAGLDLSIGMGRVAQRRLSQAGLLDMVGLVRSDTLPIPFQEAVFDGIFTSFTLELFDSPLIPAVLSEIHRVLKPGGRLVVVSLSKDQQLGLIGRIYETFHDRFPKLADCRPIPARYLIQEGGFKIQEFYEYKMWGIPVINILATPINN